MREIAEIPSINAPRWQSELSAALTLRRDVDVAGGASKPSAMPISPTTAPASATFETAHGVLPSIVGRVTRNRFAPVGGVFDSAARPIRRAAV